MLSFAALLCMLRAGTLYAQGDQTRITVKLNDAGTQTTGAWLHLPDDYNSTSEQYPLLIFFHGVGEGGTNLNSVLAHGVPKMIAQGAKMQYTVNGKLFKFIVVSPQAPNGWMDEQPLNSVLEDIKAKYRVDPDRVYLTGLSAGGYAVWNYLVSGTQYSNKIAAVVPVSAAPVNSAKLGGLCNIAASSIATWNLCGDQDSFLSYFYDYTTRIQACNPAIAPKTTLYTGMGHSDAVWDRVYNAANTYNTPNIYEWMLQYKRNGVPTANKPPIANAGSGMTITLPVSTASLDGSTSGDPDGNISKYQWTQVSGPVTAVIASAGTAKTNISGLTAAGNYIFELMVTDDKQATASGRVTVQVLAAANTAPVANAGNGSIITLPVTVSTLDGSASKDADGTITKYQWAQISGPVTATIASSNTVKTDLSKLTAAGNYVFELTITDDKQATATARVTVQVLPAVNVVPVANAGSNVSIVLPANTTTLDGSASKDPDGSITKYQWAQISGPATASFTDNTAAKTTIGGLNTAGDYIFELTVTDERQGIAKARVRVQVLAAINVAPVANTGTGFAITLPTTTASLDGSASKDTDGTITKYMWVQISGPTQAAISTSTSVKTGLSGLTITGSYVFELTVTDDKQASSAARVTVQVLAANNLSPVANAGGNFSINLPVTTVTLDGSASSDPDGNIIKFQWVQISGPAVVSFTDSTKAKATVAGLITTGDYVFELTVTDDRQGTAKSLITVQVLAATNVAPVADAGSSLNITLPVTTATLDGSASKDVDGGIIKYQWSQISGPAQVTITTSASAKTNLSGLTQVGNYVFELTVTDDKQASSAARVSVQVLAVNNLPPVANAGTNYSITLPVTTATLDGSVSRDPDGRIISLQWSQRTGPVTAVITNKNNIKTDISGLTIVGKYKFMITVADDKLAIDTAEVTIDVLASSNIAPVANAGNDFAITLPATTAVLDGSASKDDDGTITQFQWKQISGPVNASITAAGSAKTGIDNLSVAGDYVFELEVTDNEQLSNSARVTVKVNPLPNKRPVARAGNDIALTLPLSSTALDGSFSTDADGTIIGYSWKQLSGPVTAVIAKSTAAYTNINGLDSAGNYIFELTITDNRQATATDQVTITVYSDPSTRPGPPPVAHAGQDITIILPQNNATLDGAASTDGSIYQWKQISGPANAGIDQAASARTTISGLITAGNYVFELTVSNDKNESATDQITVIVLEAENITPVAGAGDNIEITIPVKEASLNGGTSFDDDGFIASYNWRIISGPEGVVILRASTVSPMVVVPKQGVYIFELTVKDNKGAIALDTVQLTVHPAEAPAEGIGVKLYPNPATTFIRLELRTKSPEPLKVSLYNIEGSPQRTYNVPDPSYWQQDIDLLNLPAGAYFLRITNNKDVNILKRVIKVSGY